MVTHRIGEARRDPTAAVLPGVHALKHAVRFGASLRMILTPDRALLDATLARVAPDVGLPVEPVEVDDDAWRAVAPRGLSTPCLTVADRPPESHAFLQARDDRPVTLLERPRRPGNLGAAIRASAAAGAAGVAVLGGADPWHPATLHGAAGLQFAVPCVRLDHVPQGPRPLVAFDPDRGSLEPGDAPVGAVLAFGTERDGLTPNTRAAAVATARIPMTPGVSSLNLAVSVGVALYLARGAAGLGGSLPSTHQP